jgi:acetoacetate decarboxylase
MEEKMEIDRTKINLMPLIRGPMWDQKQLPGLDYTSVETLMLVYETDPEAIHALLPAPFKPGKSATVTVIFADNNGVDFMAGGGYRFAAVSVAAQYDGKSGHMEGNYVLIMPENNGLPIITGRDWLGMPKFFTDISSIRVMKNGHLRCEVSLYGHMLFGVDVAPPLKKQNAIICKIASNQSSKSPSFGYKYIASLHGQPDADYPTIMWTDSNIDALWLGKSGEVYFGNSSEQDIGDLQPIFEAIKSLPVRSISQVSHTSGSMVLRLDKCGRLE